MSKATSKATSSTPTDDTPKKKNRGTSVVLWVLMAMLVAGLGGFGVTNFGGGITTIGKVGDHDIKVDDYSSALRQQMAAFSKQIGQQVSFSQAQSLGIDKQVLQSVINRAALDNEADRIGLSVGDAVVASKIGGIAAFQRTAGQFDRETYRDALKQNGLNEAEFEKNIRADATRELLQGAISGGFVAPAALTDTIAAWAGETRGFSLLRLTEADLPVPVAAPTDAELKAFYDTNIASYTRPEAKRISYAALLPDTLAKDMPLDEAKLKETYQSRLAEYMIPEKRLVERLVYPTDAEAAAAKARLDGGESFETLVAERKLTLEDIDLGDVSKADLAAAGDAVFALAGPGIVGPFASDLGPALFRMNAVLAAQDTTFDEARAQLAIEQQTEAARKAIAGKVEAIDDLLAGGATLADVAKEQGMTLATTDYAAGADDNDAIAGYTAFRDAATKLAEGDFPEAVMLDDGGLVALQLQEVVPPTAVPFDKIREKVTAAWRNDTLTKALSTQAISLKAAVEGGGSLGAYGIVERTAKIDRQGQVQDAPPEVLQAVFEMVAGDVRVIEAAGFAGLVQLDSIAPATTMGDDATAMRQAIATQAAQAISADAFTLFTTAMTAQAGISLDQAAINAVHAQINN